MFYFTNKKIKRIITEAAELYNEHLCNFINIDDYPSILITQDLPIKIQVDSIFGILENLFEIKIIKHFDNPDAFSDSGYPNPNGYIFSITVIKKNKTLFNFDTRFGKRCKTLPKNIYYVSEGGDGRIKVNDKFGTYFLKEI